MGISAYIKEIARAARGAGAALEREQAAELFGQILDGVCTDLEIGAFCVAMRIKGETPQETAGFLDALQSRLGRPPRARRPVVVLPSYRGARKLPLLTPLLALVLARKGLPVLMHGTPTESGRVTSQAVLALLGVRPQPATQALRNGQVNFVPTESLHPGLKRLLSVRRAIGMRNSAHHLVTLMNPIDGPALVVCGWAHSDDAKIIASAIELTGERAMLLRGAEGEPVADPRRVPRMDVFLGGAPHLVQESLPDSPPLPAGLPQRIDAALTAEYILAVLKGERSAPRPILMQADHILRACKSIEAERDPSSLRKLTA